MPGASKGKFHRKDLLRKEGPEGSPMGRKDLSLRVTGCPVTNALEALWLEGGQKPMPTLQGSLSVEC